jgi:hypothetical protein
MDNRGMKTDLQQPDILIRYGHLPIFSLLNHAAAHIIQTRSWPLGGTNMK